MDKTEKEIEKIEEQDAWDENDQVVSMEVKKPLDKVIPIRLSSDKWEEIRQEARELGIGPSTLTRMWILDRLRQKIKAI
jgi:predicted DNA binding CopG/RHH family protein